MRSERHFYPVFVRQLGHVLHFNSCSIAIRKKSENLCPNVRVYLWLLDQKKPQPHAFPFSVCGVSVDADGNR